MDIFYRIENREVLKKWAYYRIKNDNRFTYHIKDEQSITFYYKNRVATYSIWPAGIIEETVLEDDKILFYLHFQLRSFNFAIDMFNRMINTLTKEEDQIKKILLCCSGGMTTSFFAEKMNKYIEINKLSYHVDAKPMYAINQQCQEYEMILVAPQLKYQVNRIKELCQGIPVIPIDSSVFATYDCYGLLKQIEDQLN